MNDDSTDHPEASARRRKPRFRQPDLPPQDAAAADIDSGDTASAEEDDEARLPEVLEEPAEAIAEGPLAVGHAAIEHAVRLRPDLARRLPHAQCGQRRALCRQGQERPQAADVLRPGHMRRSRRASCA